MKRLFAMIMIATMVLISVVGCNKVEEVQTPEKVESTQAVDDKKDTQSVQTDKKDNKNIIVDDLGKEVEIPEKLERIVVADLPPLVHALYVVNGGSEGVIGAPTTYALEENMFPTVYPEVLELETGFRKGGNINIEELMNLKPDLILYRADDPEGAKLIQSTGIPCVAFQTTNADNGNVVTPIASWIEDLEQILGKEKPLGIEEKSYASMGFVNSRVWDIEPITSGYITLKGDKIDMLGKGQFSYFWSKATNTVDVGAKDFSGSKEISVEQLYKYDPEILFLGLGSQSAEEFMKDERFKDLKAVKSKRVYKAPEGLFSWFGPSTDVPLAFLWYAKLAHPEQFADVDVVSITKEYYKDMYDYDLTDENLEFLFANGLEELYASK